MLDPGTRKPMQVDVHLRIEITDTDALTRYVSAFIHEYGLDPCDVDGLDQRELLTWLYDPGSSFPGTKIISSTFRYVTPVHTAAANNTRTATEQEYVLPGFVRW